MKRTLLIVMLIITLIGSPSLARIHAQVGGGYELTWWTVDNGGGASAGGGYSLIGTISQSDAGSFNSGEYTLNGGFWTGIGPLTANYRVFLPMILR